MTSKIDRIIARLQKRITEGQFEEQYEAAQETRLVAARYTKQANWPAAIDILSSVAQALLRAGQGGSGGDLAVLLVDVYRQAELKPDGVSRGKLLGCLRLFEQGEPTRKKFVKEMIECVFGLACFGFGWGKMLTGIIITGGQRSLGSTPPATRSCTTSSGRSTPKSTRPRRRSGT
jgi:hypothetical protein